MKSRNELLKEYLIQFINVPLNGLVAFIESGDWDAVEDILANLLERVRKHIGIQLMSREEQGGIVTEKWKIAGDRQN